MDGIGLSSDKYAVKKCVNGLERLLCLIMGQMYLFFYYLYIMKYK